MIQIETVATNVSLMKIGKALDVDIAKLPQVSLSHIFDYGLRQILNDAMASAKTESEALASANKRLDNLLAGTLRASAIRQGDPIKRRAAELAEASVRKNQKFQAWLAANKLKSADKDAKAMIASQVAKAIAPEGNAFVKQATLDVEAAKGIGEIELEL